MTKNENTLETYLKWSLATLLFLLPWQTIYIVREVFVGGVKFEYATIGYYATEVLLWGCVFLFMAWYWRKMKEKAEKGEMVFAWTKDRLFLLSALVVIVYFFLSTLWAIDFDVAFQRAFHVLEAFLLFFMISMGPLKLFSAMRMVVFSSIVPSVLGIWQALSQSSFAYKWLGVVEHVASEPGASIVSSESVGRFLRAYGPFSHPNVFGGFLVLTLTTTIFLTLRDRTKKYKGFLAASLYIQLYAFFFTYSRSALLAFMFAGTGLYLGHFFRGKQRSAAIVHLVGMIAVGVLLGSLFFAEVGTRSRSVSVHEQASISERVSQVDESLSLFASAPLVGVGAAQYPVALGQAKQRAIWEVQPVHNVGLLMHAELGILGMFFVATALIMYVRFVWAEGDKDRKRGLRFVLLVCCFAPLFLFDHYLFSSYIGLMFFGVGFALLTRTYFDPSTDGA